MCICDELGSNSASDYGGVGEEYDYCFRMHWNNRARGVSLIDKREHNKINAAYTYGAADLRR